MMRILYNQFQLNISTVILTIVLLVSLPVTAIANQPALNGAINPREPNFFTRGREQFEREIQLLLKRSHSPLDPPLQISPQQQRLIREQFELLEKSESEVERGEIKTLR